MIILYIIYLSVLHPLNYSLSGISDTESHIKFVVSESVSLSLNPTAVRTAKTQ